MANDRMNFTFWALIFNICCRLKTQVAFPILIESPKHWYCHRHFLYIIFFWSHQCLSVKGSAIGKSGSRMKTETVKLSAWEFSLSEFRSMFSIMWICERFSVRLWITLLVLNWYMYEIYVFKWWKKSNL